MVFTAYIQVGATSGATIMECLQLVNSNFLPERLKTEPFFFAWLFDMGLIGA